MSGPGDAPQTVAASPAGRRTGILIAIVLWSLALRCQSLAVVSSWFDESHSWKVTQAPWGDLCDLVSRDNHPPAYFALSKLWGQFFGDAPRAQRLLSAICGALAVIGAYGLARTIARRIPGFPDPESAGLLAAAAVGLSPPQIEVGMEHRMYAFGVLLAIIAAQAALAAAERPGSLRAWIGFALVGSALALTHYAALFIVLAIGGFLLLESVWRRRTGGDANALLLGIAFSMVSIASAFLVGAPAFFDQRNQVSQQFWLGEFRGPRIAEELARLLTLREIDIQRQPSVWIAVIAWIVIGLRIGRDGSGGRLLCGLVLVPPIGLVLYSLAATNILLGRYLLFSQVFVLIAAAILVSGLKKRRARIIAATLVIAWLGFWTVRFSQLRSDKAANPGLRLVTETLNEWRRNGEPVLVSSPYLHPTIQRYARRPQGIFVLDRGSPYRHFGGGSILEPGDYLAVEKLPGIAPTTLFVIESAPLAAPNQIDAVPLGPEWRTIRSIVFDEHNGQPCRVILHERTRRP